MWSPRSCGFGAAVLMLRFWKPSTPDDQRSQVENEPLTRRRVSYAVLPYVLVIAVFALAKLNVGAVDVPKLLGHLNISVEWPGLYGELLTPGGDPSSSAIYKLEVLGNPGTLLIISGILVTLIYRYAKDGDAYPLTASTAVSAAGRTLRNMRGAIMTVATVLALSYVMNQSGQTVAIGTWLATAGGLFALLSPILGWLGTAVTGSDTSANALFANLQQTAGQAAGIDPTLLVAANTSGGVVAKLVSPQNLTIAATAVGMPGSERILLRKVVEATAWACWRSSACWSTSSPRRCSPGCCRSRTARTPAGRRAWGRWGARFPGRPTGPMPLLVYRRPPGPSSSRPASPASFRSSSPPAVRSSASSAVRSSSTSVPWKPRMWSSARSAASSP